MADGFNSAFKGLNWCVELRLNLCLQWSIFLCVEVQLLIVVLTTVPKRAIFLQFPILNFFSSRTLALISVNTSNSTCLWNNYLNILTVKTEAPCVSETSVVTIKTTRRQSAETHNRYRSNFKMRDCRMLQISGRPSKLWPLNRYVMSH
jgi:hypothetical protein